MLVRMLVVWVVFVLFGCAKNTAGPAAAPGTRILFIGNSLTYVNDLPRTLAAIALFSGDTMRIESVAEPNFALIDHYNGLSNAVAAIGKDKWDFVVLQQGPTSLGVSRDTLILAARLLEPHIRAAGARAALYMVWPDATRKDAFAAVRQSYQLAAQAVNGVFLPAGEAWQSAWRQNPQLALYGPDGFHPSPLGTYLAALVMYERFTGKDARALPATATVDGQQLNVSAATIRLLQQAAHDTNAAF